MELEMNDEECGIVRHALESYLSDLREEIVRTNKHDWSCALHKEEQALTWVIQRLG